jgi:site-specific DNA-methyltransferase (adenine-specific)
MTQSKRLAELYLDPDLPRLPQTSREEDAALREAVSRDGPVHSLVVDEQGAVLDGERLYRLYAELGVTQAPVVVLVGLTPEQRRLQRLGLNLNRRMTCKQKRELIKAELTWWDAHKGLLPTSNRLAPVFGCDDMTITRVREEMQRNSEIRNLPLEAADGKRWQPRVPCLLSEVKEVKIRAGRAGDNLPAGVTGVRGLWKASSRAERQRLAREEAATAVPDTDYRLLFGDYRDLLAEEAETADHFLLDPLWRHTIADRTWGDLAVTAGRVLRPGGLFVAFSGVGSLNVAYRQLDRHLHYLWTIALEFGGGLHPTGRGRRFRVANRWRPILVYCKDRPPDRVLRLFDHKLGAGRAKAHHDYEQNVRDFVHLLRIFTLPGELICDPCAGSFTCACACKETCRRYLGCEIDRATYEAGVNRFARHPGPARNPGGRLGTRPAARGEGR